MAQYIVSKIDAHVQIWAWKKDYIDSIIAAPRNNNYGESSGQYLSVTYNSTTGHYKFVPLVISGTNVPSDSVPVTVLNQGLNPGQTTVLLSLNANHIRSLLNSNEDDLYGVSPVFYNGEGVYYEVGVGTEVYLVPRIGVNESVLPIRVRYVYKMEYYSTEDTGNMYYAVVPQTGYIETVLNGFGNYKLVAGIKPYAESSLQIYDCEDAGYAEVTDTGITTGIPYYIKLTTSMTGIAQRPNDGIKPTIVDENIDLPGGDPEAELIPLPDNAIPQSLMEDGVNTWELVDDRGNVLTGGQEYLIINPYNSWVNKRIYAVTSYVADRTIVSYVADSHGYYPLVDASGDQIYAIVSEIITKPVASMTIGTSITMSNATGYVPPISVTISNMDANNAYTRIARNVLLTDVYYRVNDVWVEHGDIIRSTVNTAIEIDGGGSEIDVIQYTMAQIATLGSIVAPITAMRYNMDVSYTGTLDNDEYTTNSARKNVARGMIDCITIDSIVPMYDSYTRWTHTEITQSIKLAESTEDLNGSWDELYEYNSLLYAAGAVTARSNPYTSTDEIPNTSVRKTLGRADRITKSEGTITITTTIQNTLPCSVPVNGEAIRVNVILSDYANSAYKEYAVYATPPPPSQISKNLR